MDITCMKNQRENKDIRTRGQVLFQEQKGAYALCLSLSPIHRAKFVIEIPCPYVLLSKNLHEKTYQPA